MLIRRGEQKVEAGTYWDIKTGERFTFENEGVLPGDVSTRYIKASSTTVLFLGPILGLSFAIFLPFIGIVMSLSYASKKIARVTRRSVRDMRAAAAKNIFFGWRPLQAYLAKKHQDDKEGKNAEKMNSKK